MDQKMEIREFYARKSEKVLRKPSCEAKDSVCLLAKPSMADAFIGLTFHQETVVLKSPVAILT